MPPASQGPSTTLTQDQCGTAQGSFALLHMPIPDAPVLMLSTLFHLLGGACCGEPSQQCCAANAPLAPPQRQRLHTGHHGLHRLRCGPERQRLQTRCKEVKNRGKLFMMPSLKGGQWVAQHTVGKARHTVGKAMGASRLSHTCSSDRPPLAACASSSSISSCGVVCGVAKAASPSASCCTAWASHAAMPASLIGRMGDACESHGHLVLLTKTQQRQQAPPTQHSTACGTHTPGGCTRKRSRLAASKGPRCCSSQGTALGRRSCRGSEKCVRCATHTSLGRCTQNPQRHAF